MLRSGVPLEATAKYGTERGERCSCISLTGGLLARQLRLPFRDRVLFCRLMTMVINSS